ncbi:MAG TPA: hypothetical protein VFB83_03780 [Propionibacteriaceae bacterium]|nr:hypothetical protein [Propionibacteriaceae bacterium]
MTLRLPMMIVALLVLLLGLLATASFAAPNKGPQPTTNATGRTLAEAASRPHGIGARDVTPEGATRDPSAAPAMKQLRDKRGNRVTLQGCLLDYGRGDACLPAVPPAAADMGMDEVSMPWNCAQVRKLTPKGIKVTGKDVLGLDTNRDKVACGQGDRP